MLKALYTAGSMIDLASGCRMSRVGTTEKTGPPDFYRYCSDIKATGKI